MAQAVLEVMDKDEIIMGGRKLQGIVATEEMLSLGIGQ